MKAVWYGSSKLHDAPDVIQIRFKDGEEDGFFVGEGTGIKIVPGWGVMVLSLFKIGPVWRYRFTSLIPWDSIRYITLAYPRAEDVPQEVWSKAEEIVEEPDEEEIKLVAH
jgi:hypothetical protein